MKKFKYAFWLLLVGFLGLLVYQNQGVFLAKHQLDINLGFVQYHVPEVYSILIIAVFFFGGILLAYAASLFERYRAHRQIKSLKQTVDAYTGTITKLKQEVDGLKPQALPDDSQQPVDAEAAGSVDLESNTSRTS